jgi:hypothetical protein
MTILSQLKTPRRKVVESAQPSGKKSGSTPANVDMRSAPDVIVSQQKPLAANEVMYLQRSIGNTATVRLLAGQRQSGATPRAEAGGSVTVEAAPLAIQRFPTSEVVKKRSDKASYKKNLAEKAVKALRAPATFDAVLGVVDTYNKLAAGPVGVTTDLRQRTFTGSLLPALLEIRSAANRYLSDHIEDKDRPKTIQSFTMLHGEIDQEILLLAEVIHDTSYDAQPKGHEVAWNLAIYNQIKKLPNPAMMAWITDLGISISYLKVLKPAALDALEQADKELKNKNIKQADKWLAIFQRLEPDTYLLVRSALMRKHLNNINPQLAAVFNDPNFKQMDDAQKKIANDSLGIMLPDGKFQAVAGEGILGFAQTYLKHFSEGLVAKASSLEDEKVLGDSADKEITEHKNRQQALDQWYVNKNKTPPLGIDKDNKEYRSKGEHVHNYKQRRDWENKNVNAADYSKASDHAKTMITAYTFNYSQFNSPLRGDLTPEAQGGNFSNKNLALTQGMISGLNELPLYAGYVYRHDSIFTGFDQLRRVGSVMTDMAVISATREASSLKLISGSGSAEVLSVIRSKTGRFAKPLSQYNARHSDENEVIFKPGTQFRIMKRVDAILNHNYYQFPPEMETELRTALKEDQEKATIKHILLMEEM